MISFSQILFILLHHRLSTKYSSSLLIYFIFFLILPSLYFSRHFFYTLNSPPFFKSIFFHNMWTLSPFFFYPLSDRYILSYSIHSRMIRNDVFSLSLFFNLILKLLLDISPFFGLFLTLSWVDIWSLKRNDRTPGIKICWCHMLLVWSQV